MNYTNRKSGFTLVELAIVLVIIGLIVGGVLAGQDLIKAAEVRATVGQLEKYDTAVNTFRGKYNGLPGDLTTYSNFGFVTTGLTGGTNAADGDGLIDASADTTGTEFDQEAAAFFSHLASAGLVSETISATDFTTANVDAIASYAPISKMGRGSLWTVRQTSGTNYYLLSVPTVTNGVLTITDGVQVPVIDSLNFDSKLDDGLPTTGKVIAVTDYNSVDAGGAAADDICVNTTPTPDAYNTGTTSRASDTECILRIRASF